VVDVTVTALDVHSPIIYNFRRYPSVNGAIGRESTAEEIVPGGTYLLR
jgi:uncharacterized protein (DUF924 family)